MSSGPLPGRRNNSRRPSPTARSNTRSPPTAPSAASSADAAPSTSSPPTAAPTTARQAIVVGDEMQLPPTNFFAARRDGGEDDDADDDAENGASSQPLRLDLEANSFLNHAARNLPSTMLGWHYRSRSESLISFSNWAFYDGRLLTVPDERLPVLPVESATPMDLLLSRPISFHQLPQAVYDNRRNRG